MPGDEIVVHARYRSTRAVTIHAPSSQVWPWLVQMGQGRGGFYSYDWLENLLWLDINSADAVVPELQGLAEGDVIRLVPEGTEPPLRFTVAHMISPHVLVLGPSEAHADALAKGLPYPCWTFQLLDVADPNTCRLVVRFQCDFSPTLGGRLAYQVLLAPVHFVMERKMMLGIKKRAEAVS